MGRKNREQLLRSMVAVVVSFASPLSSAVSPPFLLPQISRMHHVLVLVYEKTVPIRLGA